MASQYSSKLSELDARRYRRKLEVIFDEGKYIDPYSLPTATWKNDVTLWPPLEFGQIYSYLIDTPGQYTREKLRAYKSLDAFNYYISGWVQTVFYYDANCANCFMKAKVRASQRLAESHEAWVCLRKKSGDVITGHCTCMAGCGEVCSHVAGMLFKIEACVRRGMNDISCTSLPCVWNQTFSKKVQPAPATEICFLNPNKKRKKDAESRLKKHKEQVCTSKSSEKPVLKRAAVYNFLHSFQPNAAVFTILPLLPSVSSNPSAPNDSPSLFTSPSQINTYTSVSPSQLNTVESPSLPNVLDCLSPPDSPPASCTDPPPTSCTDSHNQNSESIVLCDNLPPTMSELFSERYVLLTEAELSQHIQVIFKDLEITAEQVAFIERSTTLQSNSTLWYDYRKGRITASYFQDVIRHRWKVYPKSCIKSVMQYGNQNLSTRPIVWGRKHEDTAREEYKKLLRATHENFTVRSSGLFIHQKHPFVAATPDGIVDCKCCGTGVLEIKCPFKYRFQSPTSENALSDRGYCLQKNCDGIITLKKSHKYYDQVQAQIAITNAKYSDFVCWTTKDLFYCRILPDKNYLNIHLPILERYFCTYLLPELLTHKLLNSLSSATPVTSTSVSTHVTSTPVTSTSVSTPVSDTEDIYCICRKGEFGEMVACDNATCSGVWFHFPCVNLKEAPAGTWYCPNCRK